MRREWSAWIKNRDWKELEKLARTDPSQSLADTVAELERGFSEKPDRRALRRILYFLAQAGYRPEPIDEEPEETRSEAPPFEYALLVSADGAGETVITYARQAGENVRFLNVTLAGRGIVTAEEEELPRPPAESRIERIERGNPAPFVHAQVPPAYALSRIAQAARETGSPLPPVLAYWRSTLDAAQNLPHPAANLPRSESLEGVESLLLSQGPAFFWRLELGAASRVVERVQKLKNDAEATGIDGGEAYSRARSEVASEVFDGKAIEDHATRLLDTAYLLHLRGHPGSGLYLAAADDLRAHGAESVYARTLLDKTIAILIRTWQEEKAEASASGSGAEV